MATPSTRTVQVSTSELTDRATERAHSLMTMATDFGGLKLTDREREVVEIGIDLGVTACVAALTAEHDGTADTPPAGPSSPEPPPSQ
jgi:hypothetical protein